MRVFTSRSVKSAGSRTISWIDGNGVPALSCAAICWSMLMLVAALPVEIWPVQSEAMPASCDPCAALLLRPSRTRTLLCRFVVHDVLVPLAVTLPPLAKGLSDPRNLKLLVSVAGLPYAGRVIEAPFMSVAPQTGRTQPHGVKISTR